jgi:hypothetical protein
LEGQCDGNIEDHARGIEPDCDPETLAGHLFTGGNRLTNPKNMMTNSCPINKIKIKGHPNAYKSVFAVAASGVLALKNGSSGKISKKAGINHANKIQKVIPKLYVRLTD